MLSRARLPGSLQHQPALAPFCRPSLTPILLRDFLQAFPCHYPALSVFCRPVLHYQPYSVGPPLLNTEPLLASVMGRSSPLTVEPCGRRPYNVAPVALHTPQPCRPVRPCGYCVGGSLFTSALAWESVALSTLIPVTRPSPLASQPLSPPIHLHYPSHFTLHTCCPPQASLAASSCLPYLSLPLLTSSPYHFQFGRPPPAQGRDLSRGRLVDPLPTRSPPGLLSGMPIRSRPTPFPPTPSLPPATLPLRRGRCGWEESGREASGIVGLRTVTVLLPPRTASTTFIFCLT
ncbi:hypothetical protein E2C01_017552 [Portunus trituberculatus]|uniref:Uncharacterized protein n=1 Tax=Portunus trituberculatus TaxID=210409 RepID=A0A5B7DS25_PORTR|nr:hypothetical protein [Portunus trituberculatus]